MHRDSCAGAAGLRGLQGAAIDIASCGWHLIVPVARSAESGVACASAAPPGAVVDTSPRAIAVAGAGVAGSVSPLVRDQRAEYRGIAAREDSGPPAIGHVGPVGERDSRARDIEIAELIDPVGLGQQG